MLMAELDENPVQYEEGEKLVLYVSNFTLKPKARPRVHQSTRGKRSVWSPTSSNQSQLSYAIKELMKKHNILGKFKTFTKPLTIAVCVRSCGKIKGDTDNYLKQVKDALENANNQVIKNDKLFVADYCEKIEDSEEDSVIIVIEGARECKGLNHAFKYKFVVLS